MESKVQKSLVKMGGQKHKVLPCYCEPKTEEKLDCGAARLEWGLAGR